MVKLLAAFSPVLVAVTLAAAVVDGQAPPPSQQVTAVGCIVRNGMVDVDKGTRRLNMEPNGLALTDARLTTAASGPTSSAVPGSTPDGSNTGTIPRNTIVGKPNPQPATQSFALAGNQVTALGEYVGRRVEVVGRLASTAPAENTAVRGTTGGAARSAAPVPGVGTREERPAEGSAHPSTELPRLDVISFRGVTGACE